MLVDAVTAAVAPGELTALMGPSGAGKTTVLDAMALRRKVTDGRVLHDGRELTASQLKAIAAYVQQQDSLYGMMTVRETVELAASLKMSPDVPVADKALRVDDVLREMGLERSANTLIGGELSKGCSGGERKRTSVACALCTSPRAIILDEPTSGLDSQTALEVVQSLARLSAGSGCTVVVTIHQPSLAAFSLFDGLVLLAAGKLAYCGPAAAAPAYFAGLGAPTPPGEHVVEHILTAVTSGSRDWAALFEESEYGARIRGAVACAAADGSPDASDSRKHGLALPVEWWVVFRRRALVRMANAWALFLGTRVLIYVLLAGLLATFFYSQVFDFDGVSNVTAILFVTVVMPGFVAQVHVDDMKSDRVVYTRERHDSYYRVTSYVASKVLSELPFVALAAVGYSVVIFLGVGLDGGVTAFLFFALVTTVVYVCDLCVGLAVAAICPGDIMPSVVLPVFTVINMLCMGFLVREPTIPVLWIWLYYISFMQWGWAALMTSTFGGRQWCDADGAGGFLSSLPGVPPSVQAILDAAARADGGCIDGDDVLEVYHIRGRSRWTCVALTAASLPAFLLALYVGVRFVRHEKR